jgi:DNA modification methylase
VPSLVLDPFAGSCTTLQVATWHGRDAIGCELNPAYVALGEERVATMPRCMAREEHKSKQTLASIDEGQFAEVE